LKSFHNNNVKVNNTLAAATYEAYSPNEDPTVVMHVRKERTAATIQDVVRSKLPYEDSFTVNHTRKGKKDLPHSIMIEMGMSAKKIIYWKHLTSISSVIDNSMICGIVLL
jgi:hypothetical protein